MLQFSFEELRYQNLVKAADAVRHPVQIVLKKDGFGLVGAAAWCERGRAKQKKTTAATNDRRCLKAQDLPYRPSAFMKSAFVCGPAAAWTGM